VENAAAIVQAQAERRHLQLTIDLDARLPATLVGDEDRLRQVLLNLLNNAVKFTASGWIALSVRVMGEGRDGTSLRVAVQDTGIGIPDDKQSRLFERFSQVDGSVRREFGGSGLGLAISKRLVELMGGRIGFVSQLGQGSTFWFDVTLRSADQQALVPAAPTAEASSRALRILLVDDNEINQEIARTLLTLGGHEVDVAGDGATAVLAVKAEAYDLVLMDIQMPIMDGITATQHIRALPKPICDVPIVAMTANVLPQQVAAFQAAGMNDHIGKPFRREELHAAVARFTQPPGAAAA
jgi:CheY-like chemotaxis protein